MVLMVLCHTQLMVSIHLLTFLKYRFVIVQFIGKGRHRPPPQGQNHAPAGTVLHPLGEPFPWGTILLENIAVSHGGRVSLLNRVMFPKKSVPLVNSLLEHVRLRIRPIGEKSYAPPKEQTHGEQFPLGELSYAP